MNRPQHHFDDDDDDDGTIGEFGRQRSNSCPAALRFDRRTASDENRPQTAHAGIGAASASAVDFETQASATGGAIKQETRKKPSKRNVTVFARFRPENAFEVANGGAKNVQFAPEGNRVTVTVTERAEDHEFRFDQVFDPTSTQIDIYQFVGIPVIDNLFQGVNCSILAYGQTGTGKTYTTMGNVDDRGRVIDQPGITPRLFNSIFAKMDESEGTVDSIVTINFIELYMERIGDLLKRAVLPGQEEGERRAKKANISIPLWYGGPGRGQAQDGDPLEIRDIGDGTLVISNCTTAIVTSSNDALHIIQQGLQYRSTAATAANQLSSRSHAIILVSLTSKNRQTLVQKRSQLYLVDLAGSERVSKSETAGLRLEEAKAINVSLFSLGQVITALTQKKTSSTKRSHIPYRDSKLTRLMENSLGGNALTFMCITCSPSSFNEHETIASLRFGSKASLVTTAPRRNETQTVAELQFLLEKARGEIEIQRSTIAMLRMQLKTSTRAALPQEATATIGGDGRLQQGRRPPASNAIFSQRKIDESHQQLMSIVTSCTTCPLTSRPMRDPAVCLDGHTYERKAIYDYLIHNEMRSPQTKERVTMGTLTPNYAIRALIQLVGDGDLLAVGGYSTGPKSPFVIWNVMSIVMDYIPIVEVLDYARVSLGFARACYEKDRWEAEIRRMFKQASPKLRAQASTVNLPAHKVYLTLLRAGTEENMEKALQRCVLQTGASVSLFSSTVAAKSKKRE